MPFIITNKNDLYIHIRGGDIFNYYPPHPLYAQPPFCYYEKVIKSKAFNNIYIISSDNSNIVIRYLLIKYNKIIHNINNIEYDISLLSHAYNIAISSSSFALSAIKLNDNLRELWEYDIIRLSSKLFFLHHHIIMHYYFEPNLY